MSCSYLGRATPVSHHGPNMALQRTRGLVAAQFLRFAGRSSAVHHHPGGRSPLNAVALGANRADRPPR
jgi:hypothetical protein